MGETTRYLDEGDYDQLARSLASGHGYRDADGALTAYRPVGYPLVMAAVYRIDAHRTAARLANALLLAVAAGLLGVLAQRLAPGAQALVPLGFLAFPLSAYVAALLYPQVLSVTLAGAVILLLTSPRPSMVATLWAGLLYGFLCLAVPSFLLLAPVMGLAAGLGPRGGAWFHLPRAVVMAAGVVLAIAPWTARNYTVFHALVPVSTNSGINLLIGNTPVTRADSGVNVPIDDYCQQRPGADEVERDHHCRECATDWMRANPGAAAALYVAKLAYWFSPSNAVASGQTPAIFDWVMRLTYAPLLLLALARLATARRRPLARSEWVIYTLYAAAAVTGAVFFSRVRFRVPFDLLLMPVVAAFVLDLATRRWPRLAGERAVAAN